MQAVRTKLWRWTLDREVDENAERKTNRKAYIRKGGKHMGSWTVMWTGRRTTLWFEPMRPS
jgi:hypothetical protein